MPGAPRALHRLEDARGECGPVLGAPGAHDVISSRLRQKLTFLLDTSQKAAGTKRSDASGFVFFLFPLVRRIAGDFALEHTAKVSQIAPKSSRRHPLTNAFLPLIIVTNRLFPKGVKRSPNKVKHPPAPMSSHLAERSQAQTPWHLDTRAYPVRLVLRNPFINPAEEALRATEMDFFKFLDRNYRFIVES